MRPGAAALAALLVGLLTLVQGSPTQAGEPTPEEERWLRTLLASLEANSPRVRGDAERALTSFGLDGLPVLVEARGGIKSQAAVSGLLRAIRAMGLPAVTARLAALRAAGKPAPKKIDALLAELGQGGAPGAPLEIALTEVAEADPARLPLSLTHAVAERLPEGVARGAYPVRATPGGLEVDADGDGRPETLIATGSARTLTLAGTGRRRVILWQRRGTWWAAPGAVVRGRHDATQVELLDADQDGRYDGPGDHARIGDGAFFALGSTRRVPWGEQRAAIEVVAQEGWKLRLEPDPPVEGADSAATRGLAALNRWRSEQGLAPADLDLARSSRCRRGAEYLVLNAPPGSEGRKGLSPHQQDPSRPGASAEGAEAQASSIIHATADVVQAIPSFGATMLHRIRMLGEPASGFGIGAVAGAGGGWTLLWGPTPTPGPEQTPIVVPPPGATGVPLRMGAEHPVPDAPPGYYDRPHGYPISATHGPGWSRIELRLYFAGGSSPVAGRTWSTRQPIAASHADNESSIFFAPEDPLQRDTGYEVELSGERAGRAVRWVWTFRTR